MVSGKSLSRVVRHLLGRRGVKKSKAMNISYTAIPGITRGLKRPNSMDRIRHAEYLDKVLKAIESSLVVDKYLLMSQIRKREYVDARRVYAYLSTRHDYLTLREIGEKIGRTHDLIIYYRNTATQLMAFDNEFRAKVEAVMEEIKKYDNTTNTISSSL